MLKEQSDLKEFSSNLLENQARMDEELRKLVFNQEDDEISLLNVNKFYFSLQQYLFHANWLLILGFIKRDSENRLFNVNLCWKRRVKCGNRIVFKAELLWVL
jgi:hypothetical protein